MTMHKRHVLVPVLALAALCSLSGSAGAQGAGGRFTGDFSLSAAAGVALGETRGAALDVRGLYLATAGVYGTLATDRFSRLALGSVGVEARPLFLPRFLSNAEGDRDTFELLLDSFHVSVGAQLARGESGPRSPALELGTGLELPLTARFGGPFLGAEVRWIAHPSVLRGDGGSDGLYLVTLGWRGVFGAHIADAGDRAVR